MRTLINSLCCVWSIWCVAWGVVLWAILIELSAQKKPQKWGCGVGWGRLLLYCVYAV